MTVEDRLIHITNKINILGLDIVESKHNTVVIQHPNGLQAINCSINSGTIDKYYTHIDVYRDFIICKNMTSIDEYEYDIFNKDSTDVIIQTKTLTSKRELTTLAIKEMDKDVLVLGTKIQFDTPNPYKRKYKLIIASGKTLDIDWGGIAPLNTVHALKDRTNNNKIRELSFLSKGLKVLTVDSDLNVLYKKEDEKIYAFSIESNLADKKSKLEVMDIPIHQINDWVLIYKLGNKNKIVNYSIPHGSVQKGYDDLMLLDNFIQCGNKLSNGDYMMDIYCRNKAECMKSFKLEKGRVTELCQLKQEKDILAVFNRTELSLNWYNFDCTVINTAGNIIGIKYIGTDLEIKHTGGKYHIISENLTLAILDEQLHQLWVDTEVRIEITEDTEHISI